MTEQLPPPTPPLLALTPEQLGERLQGYGRARDIWRLLREGHDPFDTGVLGRRALQRLQQAATAPVLEVVTRSTAECGTHKLMLKMEDDHHIETVIIPGRSRSTLCISSQVGCIRGCTFCMTATMGILRNLKVEEIVGQVVFALREIRELSLPPLRNIVYMGMGEPLDNFANVQQSLQLLTHEHGLRLGPSNITVSTVGTTPKKIRQLKELPARMAWSVHAASDEKRQRIVPTTRHTMEELRASFLDVMEHFEDTLMVEVTLVKGLNDSEEDARLLTEFLLPFHHGVRVNLIPVNPGRDGMFPSEDAALMRFAEIVQEAGLYCLLRRTRGQDSNAACGQLVVKEEKEGRHFRMRINPS